MNTAATAIAAATLALMPTQMPLFANPLSGANLCVAGISFTLDADGLGAARADTPDFEFTLELSSGTPVRIRL